MSKKENIALCKWVHYKYDSLWRLPCGKSQGIKVRPKQKTCLCPRDGKRHKIERIEIDELSPEEQAFREMLSQFR